MFNVFDCLVACDMQADLAKLHYPSLVQALFLCQILCHLLLYTKIFGFFFFLDKFYMSLFLGYFSKHKLVQYICKITEEEWAKTKQ